MIPKSIITFVLILFLCTIVSAISLGNNNPKLPKLIGPSVTTISISNYSGVNVNSSEHWGDYLWTDYDMPNILFFAYNQTTPAISYADTKALPGNCPAGQVVQNTTTGGVQCVAVSSGGNPFNQVLNTTSDVRFNNVTIDNHLLINSTTSLYTCPNPTGSFAVYGYEDPGGGYYAEGYTYTFYVYGKCNYQGREFYSTGYLTIDWYDLDYITPMAQYRRQFDLTSINKNGAPALRVLYARPNIERGYDTTATSFYDEEDINPWSDSYLNYSVAPQNATISNVTHIIKGNINMTGTLNLFSEMDWFSFITQGKKVLSIRPWYNLNLNAYEPEFFMENKSALLFSSADGQLRIYPDNRLVGMTPIERMYIETNRDNLIFSKLNFNTIPTVQFNAQNTKIDYLLQMTFNAAQTCTGLGDKGKMYYDYGTGKLVFCDGNTDNDWKQFVWTDYFGSVVVPKTKKLYFSDTESTYNSSMEWDGTNLVFKTNLTRAGIAWFSNNISTTGVITRSSVYDLTKGDALDNIKDTSLLVNPDGSINHSASPCYKTYSVSDCENNFTIKETRTTTYCFFFYIDGKTRCIPENRTDYHEAPDITYKGTNYTITKEKICGTRMEEGEDLECTSDLAVQGLAEYRSASDVKQISGGNYSTPALDTKTILVESILTKSKVPKKDTDYLKDLKDILKLSDKETHYAKKSITIDGINTSVLDMEQRIVTLEGALNQIMTETCLKDKNKWSWCL